LVFNKKNQLEAQEYTEFNSVDIKTFNGLGASLLRDYELKAFKTNDIL
jgi:hypothetical protein